MDRRSLNGGQRHDERRSLKKKTFAHQELVFVSIGILEINGTLDKCYIWHPRVSSRPISTSQLLPKEGVDQHCSGPIIQRDGQLCPRLGDVVGGFLSSEESVEEDEPGGEIAQHQLMAFFFYSVETLSWLRLQLFSPGHVHDEVLLNLHLMVVQDGRESSNEPLPQSEDGVLLPEGGHLTDPSPPSSGSHRTRHEAPPAPPSTLTVPFLPGCPSACEC